MDSFWYHFEPKILTKIQSKINAFFIKKNIENLCKNELILGGQGGSNEPAFRSLDLLGDTLPPKGPHSAQGEALGGQMEAKELQNEAKMEPNGGQGAPKWSQNGAKIEPKGSQMERKWSSK